MILAAIQQRGHRLIIRRSPRWPWFEARVGKTAGALTFFITVGFRRRRGCGGRIDSLLRLAGVAMGRHICDGCRKLFAHRGRRGGGVAGLRRLVKLAY